MLWEASLNCAEQALREQVIENNLKLLDQAGTGSPQPECFTAVSPSVRTHILSIHVLLVVQSNRALALVGL